MNCFNHPGVPAVGICKVCQKGLCIECAVDLEHGIACKKHRGEVEMLNSYTLLSPMSLAFMALRTIMVLSGLFMDIIMDKQEPIFQFIGIGMVFWGGFFSMLGSKLRKHKSK